MKKAIASILMILFVVSVFGQITVPDSTKKEYKNIFELDATGLLNQFFFTSGTGGSGYTGLYMVSYKRIFKSNALRFGVGGNTYSNSSTENDSIENSNKNSLFNVGVGFEHYVYLKKKWNFFFGIDAVLNYTRNEYVQENSTTSSYKQEQFSYGYGVSPLLGVQFKFNERLSVSSETNYSIIYTKGESKRTNTPDSSFDTESKSNGILTTFRAPVNINFRIHF